jgi:hypothetical protein
MCMACEMEAMWFAAMEAQARAAAAEAGPQADEKAEEAKNSAAVEHLSPRAGRGRRARRVRGPIRESEPLKTPPHPDPLPARGEREKSGPPRFTCEETQAE